GAGERSPARPRLPVAPGDARALWRSAHQHRARHRLSLRCGSVNGKRSLRQVLARQWIAFALVLATAFAAMALLLLFILEDEFIDDRLAGVAAGIVRLESARLPERFQLHALPQAPAGLAQPMQGRRPGAMDEFR